MAITLDGSNGITTPTYGGTDTSEYSVPVTAFKNRLINGAMMIDQRNAGASVTPTDAYTLDRWEVREDTDGAVTCQQVADAPTGFIYSAKITTTTADSSLAATQRLLFRQPIEGTNVADLGFGTASASTVTLSFWVKSSLTGSFSGSLNNSGVARSYAFTYTISSANTWEQKTVTIPGDTSGTWLTNNGVGLNVYFGLGVGSDYTGTANSWVTATRYSATGATSVIGTLSATWQVTGVQLEKGSTATSFDYRPYGTELQLCQRYYEQTDTISGFSGSPISIGLSATYSAGLRWIVPKRAAPTVVIYNRAGTANKVSNAVSGAAVGTSVTANNIATLGFQTLQDSGNGLTAGVGYEANYTASAEL